MAKTAPKVVADNSSAPKYPHSVEAEQALLGAILLKNTLYDELEGKIQAEHFYVPFHASMFKAITNLISKGWEANPLTVRESMKDAAEFAESGDILQHLTGLLENASLASDTKALSGIIHTNFLQRQMMDIGAELTRDSATKNDMEGAEEVMHHAEAELFRLAEFGDTRVSIQSLKNPLKQVIDAAEAAKKRKTWLTGVGSGLTDLDKMLGGFQHSDLIILAARPSMGKTAFALNIASNAASALQNNKEGGAGVGVFSLEMSADQLATRILSGASGIPADRLTKGMIKDSEFDQLVAVAGELANTPIYLDDTPQLHINALRTRARRMVRQHKVGMIIVDYLQLMRGSGRGSEFNRVQEISDISQGLKAIARELNVPVIALSQLSRAVESRDNKRPMLSDLRESGSIEQDADIVMFLYREDYYLAKQLGTDIDDPKFADQRARLEQIQGKTELLVSKNRKGSTGTVAMQFDGPTTTFRDYIAPDQYDHAQHGD